MPDQSPSPASSPPPSARPPTARSPLRLVLSIAVMLTGAVWLLQGLGMLTAGRSFMIGDPTWTVIGAAFVLAGGVLAIRSRRKV